MCAFISSTTIEEKATIVAINKLNASVVIKKSVNIGKLKCTQKSFARTNKKVLI